MLNNLLENIILETSMSNQLIGLFNNLATRVNSKVKHISIEIYKDGDMFMNMLNTKGTEVDKGGFLPKIFSSYSVKEDIEKITKIVKDNLEKSDLNDLDDSINITIKVSNETNMVPLREASDKKSEEDDDDDEDENSKDDSDEEEEDLDTIDDDDTSEDDTSEDDIKKSDDDKVSDDNIDDNIDNENNDEDTSDEADENDENDSDEIQTMDITKIDIPDLSKLDTDINNLNILDKFILLKRNITDNVYKFNKIRPYIIDEKLLQIFDAIIFRIDSITKKIAIYIEYKLDVSSYAYNLENYFNFVQETMIEMKKLDKILHKTVEKEKK